MTEKQFTRREYAIYEKNNPICMTLRDVDTRLNELYEENQLIKKHIEELYELVKIDVDNEIEVYPKALLEGIANILKIIGDFE